MTKKNSDTMAKVATKVVDDDIAISFDHVTKRYKLYKSDNQRLMAYVFKHTKHKTKLANDDITFQIRRGESVAIMGSNGAGKSTMLKMITGVVFPTAGTVTINGRVSALLELSAGFDNYFTGRENIYLKAMLLGLDKVETRRIEKEIIEFADLGDYIDQQVRTYSSGMRARLGFAISAHIDPDILVVDEALSVGDCKFQAKCQAKIKEICKRDDVTFLLVTHSDATAKAFCKRGLVLQSGKLGFDGNIADAIKFYKNGHLV